MCSVSYSRQDIFSESATRQYACELVLAVKAVHSLGYAHRDLKPDNVLLDAAGHLRLTDLGLCKKVVDPSSPWSSSSPTEDASQPISRRPLTVQVSVPESSLPPQSPASESPATSPPPPTAAPASDGASGGFNASQVSPPREEAAEPHWDGRHALLDQGGISSPRSGSRKLRRASVQRGLAFSTVGTPDYIAAEVMSFQCEKFSEPLF